MLDHARKVPLHTWLLRIAFGLGLLAIPDVIITAAMRAPTPYVNAHLVATAGLFILAELRRQWHARIEAAIRLAELTANAEHARQH